MRIIAYETVLETVIALCEETLFTLRDDAVHALRSACQKENDAGRIYIELLLQNAELAQRQKIPISQDTGIPFFIVEWGEGVQIEGGTLYQALNEGTREVQSRYPFHTEHIHEPFQLTMDIEPSSESFVQVNYTVGDTFKISCLRLNGTSEQTAQITHLRYPFDAQQLTAKVLDIVQSSGAQSNPPLVIGIGLGGAVSKVAGLAQKALLRPIGRPHQTLEYARLEQDILGAINHLHLGPGGWGGETTALTVHIESSPSHSTLVPLCVYMQPSSSGMEERNL